MVDETSSSSPALSEAATILSQEIARLLQSHSTPQTQSVTQNDNHPVTVAVKLNNHNYVIWSRMMEIAIGGQGHLSHITGQLVPPSSTSAEYLV